MKADKIIVMKKFIKKCPRKNEREKRKNFSVIVLLLIYQFQLRIAQDLKSHFAKH